MPRLLVTALPLAAVVCHVHSARVAKTNATAGQPPPLFTPSSSMGTLTLKDALHTEDVVHNGRKVEGLSSTKDLSKMSCDKMQEYVKKLKTRYERLKVQAATQQFSATRSNARNANEEDETVDHEDVVIDKHWNADKMSQELERISLESLRVIEMYGLRCGATDESCYDYGMDLIRSFEKLDLSRKTVDGLLMEAGWLQAEAEAFLAPPETVKAAKTQYASAMKQAGDVADLEMKITSGVMVKAAACGYRPPLGAWSIPADGCNLKPEDPIMKALLIDDPDEFIRRWKEEIGKMAGIPFEYVKVDVSPCFGPDGKFKAKHVIDVNK